MSLYYGCDIHRSEFVPTVIMSVMNAYSVKHGKMTPNQARPIFCLLSSYAKTHPRMHFHAWESLLKMVLYLIEYEDAVLDSPNLDTSAIFQQASSVSIYAARLACKREEETFCCTFMWLAYMFLRKWHNTHQDDQIEHHLCVLSTEIFSPKRNKNLLHILCREMNPVPNDIFFVCKIDNLVGTLFIPTMEDFDWIVSHGNGDINHKSKYNGRRMSLLSRLKEDLPHSKYDSLREFVLEKQLKQ